ncbi:Nrap protein [Durotheca rogersii]|uniref:Nrap protein n=1 Tax=Durotheca rogersii TaxID=419775 RepID=UPI00221E7BE1|nr:Nrap protein [Durotheca rogersii]KAI5859905.1 Nrap protein [Durotheca rogersii]
MEESTPKRRKLDHRVSGVPTFDSSNSAASAMGASGASAFVLEAEELLRGLRFDYSKASPLVDDTLRRYKDIVEDLEPHEALPIGDASSHLEKSARVTIPYPDPKPAPDSPYKVALAKPAQVNVVGSWILKTNIKSQPDVAADMIVVMPSSILQEKDYLNLRYFYKRAYYLACVAARFRRVLGDTIDLTFEHLHGNLLLPILVCRPKDDPSAGNGDSDADARTKSAVAVRIVPCAPDGYFPTPKLTAASNAVRLDKTEEMQGSTREPTPFYNTTLKAEGQFPSYLRLLHRAGNSCPAFRDACVLGRVWLQQRAFSSRIHGGGFGHFEWAALMALLLQGGGRRGEPVLSPSLHSTQLFKATLQFLATANLQKKSLVIGDDPPSMDSLRQSMPVLHDAARGINLLYKMTPWSITLLTEQAKWSLAAINDSPLDQFDPLFIIKADQPLQMFDLLLDINIPTSGSGLQPADRKGFVSNFADRVYHTLKKALGERARLLHIDAPGTASWPISTASPEPKGNVLRIGVIVDPLKASQRRDYGPTHEEKKDAAMFRQFWGAKAELWQFPDGSIVESLDWTDHSHLGFPGICEAIVRYILKLRFGFEDGDVEFHGHEMFKMMPITPAVKATFDAARQAFTTFERDVRNLENLPLHVKQISPIGSDLRHASLQTPEFSFKRPLAHPIEIVLSFEVSGKWPENLAAIQRAKVAFLLRIGKSLEKAKEDIKTHIGLESASRDNENLAFLDVAYDSGAVFRLRVNSDLEEALLDRQTKDQTAERYVRTEAADLLAAYRRMYTNLPLHNQTISTFCTRFPALSASIRLTKRWFNAHKLSCHFSEELIELFVLQAFLKPYPWQIPCSGTTGFLRTLSLLSRWDWRDEPLVVDSADSLSTSQRLEISARLKAWRKIDPNMNRTVLFVATSQDVSGVAYTSHGPPTVAATRMTALARSACKAVREQGLGLRIQSVFQASLRDYDVLLHLSPTVLRKLAENSGGGDDDDGDDDGHTRFKNLEGRGAGTKGGAAALPPAPPEHPTSTLLRRLREAYASPLLFFHGGAGDGVIGALWNPHVTHNRSFTAHMPCSLKSVKGGDGDGKDGDAEQSFEVNRRAILAEIARIGGDVIEKIEMR